jgi:hypothetical protein
MATSAERMRAHREQARRGLRRFTISVSADDLSVADHGYEGATSTDQDRRSIPGYQPVHQRYGRLSRTHRLKRRGGG